MRNRARVIILYVRSIRYFENRSRTHLDVDNSTHTKKYIYIMYLGTVYRVIVYNIHQRTAPYITLAVHRNFKFIYTYPIYSRVHKIIYII